MQILLLIIARLLQTLLSFILFFYGMFRSVYYGKFLDYSKNIAISIDEFGNVVGEYLFNDLLISKNGFKFGNRNHTISYVLGKNEQLLTLSKVGKALAAVLNFIEPDHLKKAVDSYDKNY